MTKNRPRQYNKQILFCGVKIMPWHWRPLLGPVWIDESKSAKKENSCVSEGDSEEVAETETGSTATTETAPTTGEHIVAEKAAVRQKHINAGKPIIGKAPVTDDKPTATGKATTSGIAAALGEHFEEASPGVFRFKTRSSAASEDNKWISELNRRLTEMAVRSGGALPNSIDAYKKAGQTSNGVPVYTFK